MRDGDSPEGDAMRLAIARAEAGQKPVLRRLLADYLRELSAYGEVDPAYPYLDAYWDPRERRWPYLLWRGDAVAGFALVNNHAPSGLVTDFAMAEFYVAPEARGSGSGREAAVAIFRLHPGVWELGIMAPNVLAQRFWPKAIAASGAEALQRIEGAMETIYRFKIR